MSDNIEAFYLGFQKVKDRACNAPVLLYGSETLNLRVEGVKGLSVFDHRYFLRVTGVC